MDGPLVELIRMLYQSPDRLSAAPLASRRTTNVGVCALYQRTALHLRRRTKELTRGARW